MEDINEATREIVDVLGRDWIGPERARVRAKRQKDLEADSNSYLYHRPAHPLIEWTLQHDRWRADCTASGQLELYEDVLRLAAFGAALRRAKGLQNFARVLERLKNPREFHSAAFEIEIAAVYVAQGFDVVFVKESGQKTPDLAVRTDNGVSFWVECKLRDQLTRRDKRVEDFWLNLERTLTKVMRQEKLNYLVAIRATMDPQQPDIGCLRSHLVRVMREARNIGSYDFETERSSPNASEVPGYRIIAMRLSDPDVEHEQDRFVYKDARWATRLLDCCEQSTGAPSAIKRNQHILAFSCDVEPDRVAGVIAAIGDARDQLPPEGPGLVWIRLPDNIWGKNIEEYFGELRASVAVELTGAKNRRINAVILHSRFLHRPSVPEAVSLGYAPVTIAVEHVNPRTPIAIQPRG